MDIITVGSVAIDVVDTPLCSSGEVLGGSATYFAYSASFFARVGIVSIVGTDFPEEYVRVLSERKIDLCGLLFRRGRTFRWHGRYSENWDERITVEIQHNLLGEFDGTVPDLYRDVHAVFLANGSPELQLAVLNQMHSPRLILSDTMDHWIRDAPGAVREVIRRSTGILINEFEAEMLTGKTGEDSACSLHQLGPEIVVVKMGSKGSLLSWHHQLTRIPIYTVSEVRDPTGAGDCFGGGFAGYLAPKPNYGRKELVDACVYGSVMASFCIESFGLERLRQVTPAQIEERYRKVLEDMR